MELWSATHVQTLLPAVAVMAVLCWLLRRLLKNKSWAVRRIPLQIVACLLLALELGKQVLSVRMGYDLYHLPLHFCSLVLFTLPVMAFYRGKAQQTVDAIATSVCAAVFLLLMIYPCLIYSGENVRGMFTDYFHFHTVVFHNLVVLAFLLILFLDLYTPANKDWKGPLLFTVAFCAVSATMAQVLETNYANFYACNIAPLEAVRQAVIPVLGPAVTQLLYVGLLSGLNMAFVLLSFRFCRLLKWLLRRLFAGRASAVAE